MAIKNADKAYVMRGPLFAAANGRMGFYSFYDQIFLNADVEKRYLIKGGPGTGKSTFMRTVAERAEVVGVPVEYYRCSSDADSLDAVVIGGRVALLDATSPHSIEPDATGAVDELIDLGIFWDTVRLEGKKDEIKRLSEAKSRCYRQAYRFLFAAGQVRDASDMIVAPYVNKEKMKKTAQSMVRRLPRGNGYRLKIGLCNSLGMRGIRRFDTYERSAKHVVLIKDRYGLGAAFLSMLAEAAVWQGLSIRVSYDPVDTTRPDALLFEDVGVAYVVENSDHVSAESTLNTGRFIDISGRDKRREREEYKASRGLYDGLVESAADFLRQAGEYHFELEEIYKECVDFDAQSRFCASFSEKVVAGLAR